MPRKYKTPTLKAENRECQRRSRARRRDLIDDLKRRLDEFERRGTAASIELQRAARAVNTENQRLRILLEMYGVSRGEISQYLDAVDLAAYQDSHARPLRGNCQSPNTPQSRTACCCSNCQNQDVTVSKSDKCKLLSPSSLSSSSYVPLYRTAVTRPTSSASTPQRTIVPTGNERDDQPKPDARHQMPQSGGRLIAEEEEAACSSEGSAEQYASYPSPMVHVLPPVSDCFCPPQSSAEPPLTRAETLETSCDVAAAILVELHDQADAGRARLALGCSGTSNCTVDNMKIFQLMDRLG